MKHLITIAGAGPGDPELLTVKAKQRLSRAEVVLYDALPGEEILKIAPSNALLIYAGKIACDGQSQSHRQDAINRTLLQMANRGKRVVRLKGGDPMIFGRGAEEIRFCKMHQLTYEVIPGVTAAMAASSEFEIPLTERNNSSMVLLYTGSRVNGRFANLKCVVEVLKTGSTVSMYMGLKNLLAFCDDLILEGIATSTPIAILSKVSHADRSSLCATLGDIRYCIENNKPSTPAIILIGKYASKIGIEEQLRAEKLNWNKLTTADVL